MGKRTLLDSSVSNEIVRSEPNLFLERGSEVPSNVRVPASLICSIWTSLQKPVVYLHCFCPFFTSVDHITGRCATASARRTFVAPKLLRGSRATALPRGTCKAVQALFVAYLFVLNTIPEAFFYVLFDSGPLYCTSLKLKCINQYPSSLSPSSALMIPQAATAVHLPPLKSSSISSLEYVATVIPSSSASLPSGAVGGEEVMRR